MATERQIAIFVDARALVAMRVVTIKLFNYLVLAAVVVGGLYCTRLVWSELNAVWVAWRAYMIVDSRPYCIQTSGKYIGQEKSLTSWRQMTGFNFQAPEVDEGSGVMMDYTFHATLIIKRAKGYEFYNWSYWSQNWLPVSDKVWTDLKLRVACEPKPDFLYALDVF